MPNSLKCRLKWLVRKGLLSEKDLSRIYTDNDVIEKLETIKSEISLLAKGRDKETIYAIDVFDIISSHIAEMKGE